MRKLSWMIFYSTGIILCFFYCGVMQEKMIEEVWGENRDPESFIYCVIFLFMQCLISYLYSILLQNTFIYQGENKTSSLYYWSCAMTYVSGMICSNMSLDWISYPVQVLGKSCKPLPVMCISVLFGNKSYPAHKYMFVLLIIIGVILVMNDDKPSTNIYQSRFGEVLLVVSLVMDGFTAAIQERMLINYKTKALHMMASINKWSAVFLLIIVSTSGEIVSFFNFMYNHPKLTWNLVIYSVVNAQGQVFLFMTIEHFGALFSSIVTTARKVFTVLGSVFFFGHSMVPRQWVGTLIVFIALLLDSMWKSYCNEIMYSIYVYLLRKFFNGKKPKYYFNVNGFWV